MLFHQSVVPSDRHSMILGTHNSLLDLPQVENFSSSESSRSLSLYACSNALMSPSSPRSSTIYLFTLKSPYSDWRSHSAYPSPLSVASIHWDLLGRIALTNPCSHTYCSVVLLESPAITRWRRSCMGKSHRVLSKQNLIV